MLSQPPADNIGSRQGSHYEALTFLGVARCLLLRKRRRMRCPRGSDSYIFLPSRIITTGDSFLRERHTVMRHSRIRWRYALNISTSLLPTFHACLSAILLEYHSINLLSAPLTIPLVCYHIN